MGHCLPGSSIVGVRVVDEVVKPISGEVGGSSGDYRRLRGGRNSKYTAHKAKHMHGMTNALLTVFYRSTKR